MNQLQTYYYSTRNALKNFDKSNFELNSYSFGSFTTQVRKPTNKYCFLLIFFFISIYGIHMNNI